MYKIFKLMEKGVYVMEDIMKLEDWIELDREPRLQAIKELNISMDKLRTNKVLRKQVVGYAKNKRKKGKRLNDFKNSIMEKYGHLEKEELLNVIMGLVTIVKEKNEEIEGLEKEVVGLEFEVSLEKANASLERANSSLVESYSSLSYENEVLYSENRHLNDMNNDLEDAYSDLDRAYDNLSRDLDELTR